MTDNTEKPTAGIARHLAITAAFLFMPMAAPVLAQPDGMVTPESLYDRIYIEDFLVRYYYDLSQGESHALADYFTEDALLDVDGTVARGHEEIAALYQPTNDQPTNDQSTNGEERNDPAERQGRNHMLLTNPVIKINGDTATAHVVWTGVINAGVGEAPGLYEQGREDTELVKQDDGHWLITRRYISSDSGTPDRFDASYEPRGNPLRQE